MSLKISDGYWHKDPTFILDDKEKMNAHNQMCAAGLGKVAGEVPTYYNLLSPPNICEPLGTWTQSPLTAQEEERNRSSNYEGDRAVGSSLQGVCWPHHKLTFSKDGS